MMNKQRIFPNFSLKAQHTLPLTIALFLLLLFSGCPNYMVPVEKIESATPAGMGYFSLRINGAESSRTIMPVMPEKANLFYTLEFYKSGTTTNPYVIGPVPYAELSDPVLLEKGTWDLIVSAFIDAAGKQMTAQVKNTGIIINDGQITTGNVTLEPVTIGSGQGTFSWDISFPPEVSLAVMNIARTPDGTGADYCFKGVAPLIEQKDSITLDTGYYIVTFYMTLGVKTLERKEILHIYQNLESSYTNTFTASNFFAVMTGITVDPASRTIFAKGEPLDLLIYADYSDGAASLLSIDTVTSNYDPAAIGTQNLTITHTDTSFTASFTVTVQLFEMTAKIGEQEYYTLNSAIAAAAKGSEGSPTEIIILKNITTGLLAEPIGFTIPEDKYIKLTVEPGKNITINASDGDFALFSVTHAGSSLTLGPTNGGGSLTLNGNKLPASANRRGVYVHGGTLNMNSGVTVTGFNNDNGDVFVANNGSSGLLSLSGSAQIDTLTLSADAHGNAIAEIASDWSIAYLGKLNLYGGGDTIESVINLWKDKTVLRGGWLNASNIENMNFKLWNFIDASGNTRRMNTPQPPDVPYGYEIGDSAEDIGKLIVATFNIYLEARRYGEAAADMAIVVPYDYVMPRPLVIPTPGAAGITLTIKGNTTTRKITRGTEDTNADNGLFTVPSGVRLVIESIVIDGDKTTHTGNTASLIRVNAGGIFTMNAGAVLQNNRAASGGGVYVTGSSATFTMSGGDIKNNTATSNGGGVYTGSSGTFTMSGGEISGNTASGTGSSAGGGGVYIGNSGTFTMNNGTISGNNASSNGGGVYAGSTFTMSGSEISGNTATSGGGVYVSFGTFTMNNGTISGNTANGTGATNGGGGVYVNSTFNMYGGEVSGGNKAAANGGGVYNNGTFTVGKTAKVSGNTKTNNTTNNVYLPSTYITLGTGTNVPAAGMDISIQTTRADGVVVTSGATTAIQTYFKSDDDGKSVTVLSGQLIIGNLSLTPAESDFYAQVQSYGAATADMTITVNTDLTLPIPVNIPALGTAGITLTIKGNTATRKLTRGTPDTAADNGLFVVPSGARLVFESIVIDGNKDSLNGNTASLVRVNAGGRFTMNAGAVLQNNRSTEGGGVYVTGSSGTFTMSGGDIKNNTATGSGGGVYIGSSGTFTTSGGTISGNTAGGTYGGGGVYIGNSGTFTMSGGTISGNTASGTGSSAGGGGVYVYFGTFTMNSGTISGNTAISGGGVYAGATVSGSFTMSGGTISGNTANGTGATNGGGGVYVNSSGIFNMYGGEISGGNKAAVNGGGVYNAGTFTVGRTAVVRDNTKADTTTKSNIYLPSAYITLGTGTNVPAAGMDISVQTARADGVVVTSGATTAIQTYFKSDDDGKSVTVLSGQLIIGNLSLTPAESDFYAQVQSYGAATADMTITVNTDLTLPIPVNIPALGTAGITLTIKGNTATRKLTRGTPDTAADNGLFVVPSGARLVFESIVIDGNKDSLNGNTASLVRVNAGGRFTMNAGAVLQNNRSTEGGGVYVTGSSGTFTMSGGDIKNNTATGSGGGVYIGSSGTFTTSGGTISGNTAGGTYGGGGVYIGNSGTFTMSGGTISGNTASGTGSSAGGGGVYVYFGTFTMNSGTISGNTAISGGGVYAGATVSGSFTMSGGTISGNTANGTGATNGGGGVYVNSSGIFNMYGGEISGGNKAAVNGGGVYNAGTFTVGRTAKVSGNTKTDNTTRNNVYLPSTYITLGTGTNIPATGMDISVQTTRADGVIAQSITNGTVQAYFQADEAGKSVVFDVNVLKIQ
jgi:hypothetical protein